MGSTMEFGACAVLVKSNVKVDTRHTKIEAECLETACGLIATRSMPYESNLQHLLVLELCSAPTAV